MSHSNRTTLPPPVDSILWAEVTSPTNANFWARTSRLLANSPPLQKQAELDLLKAGRMIIYEASSLTVQCVPMPARDRKRLAHLLTFEQAGFRLATFRQDIALFYQGDQDYYSMNEMAERGLLPTPSIAVSQWTIPITSCHGQLMDVFVPIELGPINFYPPSYLAPNQLPLHKSKTTPS